MNKKELQYVQKEFIKGSTAVIKYRALLRYYGRHTPFCDFTLKPGGICDCGWDKVGDDIIISIPAMRIKKK